MHHALPLVLVAWIATGAAAQGPLASLPEVRAADGNGDGRLDQSDLDLAQARCRELQGCRLRLVDGTWHDIAWTLSGPLPKGLDVSCETPLGCELRLPVGARAPLIALDPSAPAGTRIHGLRMRGLKEQQPPDCGWLGGPGSCGVLLQQVAVLYDDPKQKLEGLVVADNDIEGFVCRGIQLRNAVRATISGNAIRHIGCHRADTPCPRIDAAVCPAGTPCPRGRRGRQPDRTYLGRGMTILPGSEGVVIRGNRISKATKYGILGGFATQRSSAPPHDLTIEDNVVEDSMNGLVVNGARRYIVRNNVCHRAGMTGWIGNAARCFGDGNLGRDALWEGNQAFQPGGSGFQFGNQEGSHRALGNRVYGACQGGSGPERPPHQRSDFHYAPGRVGGPPWPQGFEFSGNSSHDSRCEQALRITHVEGFRAHAGRGLNALSGGTRFGVSLGPSADVVLAGLRVVRPRPGGERGITTQAGLSRIVVQPSVEILGYAEALAGQGERAVTDCRVFADAPGCKPAATPVSATDPAASP